jgi:hypothetical protein
MLINFHGCTVPRGWSRTWPHLVSMEAVKGEECYSFARDYPAIAPRYNTVSVFTRNVVGPMDLTPSAFSDHVYPHRTTYGHELALPVVVECGLVHFADSVSAYRDLPDGPREFLCGVPAAWDDTRLLSGDPGRLAVVARRRGDQWYVGAINGEQKPAHVDVLCSFLDDKDYEVHLIGDGDTARSFRERRLTASKRSVVPVRMLPFGGGVLHFRPAG